MSLFSKVDRALAAQKKINEAMRREPSPYEEEDEEGVKLEKGDFFSMWSAAMLTIFLPALGVLALIGLIAYLLIPG